VIGTGWIFAPHLGDIPARLPPAGPSMSDLVRIPTRWAVDLETTMGSPNPERDRPPSSDHFEIHRWANEYEDWAIAAYCPPCIAERWLYAKDWLRVPNPPLDIGQLMQRVSCEKCGSRALQRHWRFVGARRN
jgi:hypothetical protein